MLARVAENLYWIGRYIERMEHCVRYSKVQYFSTLDAPMSQSKEFTLRSILFMTGSEFNRETSLDASEVWRKVIFDLNNTNSLYNIAYQARENARSIRNTVSFELWEAINKLYLYLKELEPYQFSSLDISDFAEKVTAHVYILKSTMHMTLLHNDLWAFLNLGMYTERALQVLRIMSSKISDNQILSENGANLPLRRYQWTTLLKSLESFDVYTQYAKDTEMQYDTIFKFLLMNRLFPRSLHFALYRIHKTIDGISARPLGYPELLGTFEETTVECTKFDSFADLDAILEHIEKSYGLVAKFHKDVNELYFQ